MGSVKVLGWIRWKGLIAFVGLGLLLCALWLLVVDGLIERGIERVGTRVVGARVDLDGADLKLFPLGLTLTRLQVTNPDEPMRNAVEVGRIAFSLDGIELLERRVIIEEMAIDSVRLDTPRKASGAVAKRKKEGDAGPGPAIPGLPSFELPDVKGILESEELETLKLAKAIEEDVSRVRAEWTQRIDALPDKEKIESYRNRIRELAKAKKSDVAGIAALVTEVQALKGEIEADLNLVRGLKDGFEKDYRLLEGRVSALQTAPQNDVRRLTEKYLRPSAMLGNLSTLIFGDRISSWVRTAFEWYDRIKPLLERTVSKSEDVKVVRPVRAQGFNVLFTERNPLPDFLVRVARVSAELEAGAFGGKVQNITPYQDILGLPLTFFFSGQNLKKVGSVQIDGMINHVSSANPRDALNLAVQKVRVGKVVLSGGHDLPVTLNEGILSASVNARLSGEALSANISANMDSVRLSAGEGEGASAIVKAVDSALRGVSRFSLRADIEGTREKFDVSLSSDLDRVLRDAVGGLIREEAAKFRDLLASEVRERTGGALAAVSERMNALEVIGIDLGKKEDVLGELLNELLRLGPAPAFKLPF